MAIPSFASINPERLPPRALVWEGAGGAHVVHGPRAASEQAGRTASAQRAGRGGRRVAGGRAGGRHALSIEEIEDTREDLAQVGLGRHRVKVDGLPRRCELPQHPAKLFDIEAPILVCRCARMQSSEHRGSLPRVVGGAHDRRAGGRACARRRALCRAWRAVVGRRARVARAYARGAHRRQSDRRGRAGTRGPLPPPGRFP